MFWPLKRKPKHRHLWVPLRVEHLRQESGVVGCFGRDSFAGSYTQASFRCPVCGWVKGELYYGTFTVSELVGAD